jgi:hypothetical protein
MVKCADRGCGIEHNQSRDSNCNSQHVSKIAQLLPSFCFAYPDADKISGLAPCTLIRRLVHLRVAGNVCYRVLTEQEIL